jgi:ABC-type Fe3+-hydroxamate transport system substrate-binding protein
LGNLTGRSDAAEQQALKFEQGWQQLAARYATAPSLTVVPQVGDSPALTVNDHQFVAAALAACHTRNPFGGEAAAVPLIAPEALLAARPDAMVALAEPKTARRWFARWQHLPLHAAMLDAPADTLGRPGPRVLGAAQALCAKLDQLRRR